MWKLEITNIFKTFNNAFTKVVAFTKILVVRKLDIRKSLRNTMTIKHVLF